MKALSFFSRFAFICNVLFVFCLVIQRTHDIIGQKEVSGIIVTLGWLVSPFLNLGTAIFYIRRLVRKKPLLLPVWLVVTNLVFLVIQFFIFFIFPA